jgi:uncharacterized protein (TIGR03435 family)
MDFKVSGSRVTMEGYSAFLLVLDAYHLKGNYQISLAAVPRQEDEIREVMYDVVARAPGKTAPARDEIRKMLQTLLRIDSSWRSIAKPGKCRSMLWWWERTDPDSN